MRIAGYNLRGYDNGTSMFSEDPSLPKCPSCGYRLDFSLATNPKYVLRRNDIDISVTYDGQKIVSKAFKEFCDRNEYRGIKFGIFENDPNHFHLVVTPIVRFDANRRRTRFEKFCPRCENYESVVGADPTYLLISSPLEDDFYRSDLLFGTGNEKHPLVLIGDQTKQKLEAAKLKGLDFAPAYNIDGHQGLEGAHQK